MSLDRSRIVARARLLARLAELPPRDRVWVQLLSAECATRRAWTRPASSRLDRALVEFERAAAGARA